MPKVKIPFSGFYESHHAANLEDTLARMTTCSYSGMASDDAFDQRARDLVTWGKVFYAYSRLYAETFIEHVGLKARFAETWSPREYNFETDEIYVTVSLKNLRKMRSEIPPEALEKVAKDWFTSRPGFMCFYSPDFTTWGRFDKWKGPQYSCLLKAWVDTRPAVVNSGHDGFDFDAETALVEDFGCNGELEDILCNAMKGKGCAQFWKDWNAWDEQYTKDARERSK